MKLPSLAVGLLVLAFSTNLAALQLGQLSTNSRLGENLAAAVELYGIDAAAAATLKLELKPDISAPRGGAERVAVAALVTRVVSGPGIRPYIALSSNTALTEPVIRFRLRASHGTTTTIARYTIAPARPLPPRIERPVRTTARSDALKVPPSYSAGSYGPVRPGQTLWRILRELGLTGGETTDLINRIVSSNPQAFVNGDADRLKVGVMLEIPARPVAASGELTSAPAAAPAPTAPAAIVAAPAPAAAPSAEAVTDAAPVVDAPQKAAAAAAIDAQTQARLDALAEKFAAIRARYAEQQQAAATPPVIEPAATPAVNDSVVAPTADNDRPGRAENEPRSTPTSTRAVAPVPDTGESTSLTMLIIMAVSALIAAVVLLRGAAMVHTRWQRHREHRAASVGDQALVAEIALKAEKRLRLEDEVKRRLTSKRDEPVAAPSTIERSIDRAEGVIPIEEIENRIAHGQYAEAEAMLKAVIEKTPNNSRAKLRLVEIFYLNERADEFVELASEIAARHREDIGDDGWQRVMRMGKVIAPDRPPFSGPVSVADQA